MASVGDFVEVRHVVYTPQQVGINVMHYVVQQINGVGPSMQVMADSLDALRGPNYKPTLNANARWRGVGVRLLYPVMTQEFISVANDGIGTTTGNLLPTQVRGLIHFRTAIPGRKGRGRIYPAFCGSTGKVLPNGAPDPTFTNALALLGSALALPVVVGTAPNDATLVPVVWNREFKTGIPISGYSVPAKWATQRRSGQFGRENATPF